MKTMLEVAFYALLAAPWLMLLGLAVADEVVYRRRFRK